VIAESVFYTKVAPCTSSLYKAKQIVTNIKEV